MPLSRQSVGIYQETSSHTTHLGTLCHSRLSSLSHYRLIRVELVCASLPPLLKKKKKKKSAGGERIVEHSPNNLRREEKATLVWSRTAQSYQGIARSGVYVDKIKQPQGQALPSSVSACDV